VRDGIGRIISIFDGSVKSQKPEQRVGLKASMPKLWTIAEAKTLLQIKICGPTVAVIYRLRRVKPEIMRNKEWFEEAAASFRAHCLPWGWMLSLVE
jgi:hypothetical protein